MIALLLAFAGGPAIGAATPAPVPTTAAVLAPRAVLTRYAAALARVRDPRVFTVEYTLVQTGTRTLEQTHRIFRDGGDERDEMLAVNGTRSSTPVVRIFRRRPYRYTVAALAPKPSAYDFTYTGPHRDGKHVDYVFDVTPKAATAPPFAFTQVIVDGVYVLAAVRLVRDAPARRQRHGDLLEIRRVLGRAQRGRRGERPGRRRARAAAVLELALSDVAAALDVRRAAPAADPAARPSRRP